MRTVFLIATICLSSACSSTPVRRCDGPFSQSDVMLCQEQVPGAPSYLRYCEKPVGLYQGCATPQ